MTGFLARIKAYVLGACAFLLAVWIAFRAGRSKGKTDNRIDQLEEMRKNQVEQDNKVTEVDNEVNKMADGDALNELRAKWMRDEK